MYVPIKGYDRNFRAEKFFVIDNVLNVFQKKNFRIVHRLFLITRDANLDIFCPCRQILQITNKDNGLKVKLPYPVL